MIVKACPVCGQIALHSCHHDGDDRTTENMPIEYARDLIDRWIAATEKELAELKAHRERYHYGKNN